MDTQGQINQLSQTLAQVQMAAASKESELMAKLESALGEINRIRRDLQGMTITGAGFAGSGPRGISYVAPKDPSVALAPGFTGNITVCVDNGDSTFTKKTAAYDNGRVMSVS